MVSDVNLHPYNEDAAKLIQLRNEHRVDQYRWMSPDFITTGVMS